MYLQRDVPHLPAAGEIVIFDRSWYNRAGVERVMGFCTDEQAKRFLEGTPLVEKAIVESGVTLIKYWLEVSPEEQTRRLAARIDDGRKTWKLSPMDLKSYGRWYDYSAPATRCSPPQTRPGLRGLSCVRRQEKGTSQRHPSYSRARPHEKLPHEKVKLPKRQKADGYQEPDYPFKLIPELYDQLSAKEKCHGRPQHVLETARRASRQGPQGS